jgi:hypothetical protein
VDARTWRSRDNTYAGFIDVPPANATVPPGSFQVAGWFVDTTAQGWAGADDVQVFQGTMDGSGTMLARASFAQSRPDVAAALANPYWAASGFNAILPAGSLSTGGQTLSVYAQVLLGAERDNGGSFLGEADLGFSDSIPAGLYGSQFGSAGWRLTFKPTKFHTNTYTMFVYARSAVSGKEDVTSRFFAIRDS